jgi:hypothetical protein
MKEHFSPFPEGIPYHAALGPKLGSQSKANSLVIQLSMSQNELQVQ